MDSARHIDLNMGRPAEETCYRQKLINRADGAVHVIIIYNVCGYYLVSDSYAKWNWNYYITNCMYRGSTHNNTGGDDEWM